MNQAVAVTVIYLFHRVDKESGTINITATFDVFTSSNSSDNVTDISEDTVNAINNAIEGAVQQMNITCDKTSLEMEGKNRWEKATWKVILQ